MTSHYEESSKKILEAVKILPEYTPGSNPDFLTAQQLDSEIKDLLNKKDLDFRSRIRLKTALALLTGKMTRYSNALKVLPVWCILEFDSLRVAIFIFKRCFGKPECPKSESKKVYWLAVILTVCIGLALAFKEIRETGSLISPTKDSLVEEENVEGEAVVLVQDSEASEHQNFMWRNTENPVHKFLLAFEKAHNIPPKEMDAAVMQAHVGRPFKLYRILSVYGESSSVLIRIAEYFYPNESTPNLN